MLKRVSKKFLRLSEIPRATPLEKGGTHKRIDIDDFIHAIWQFQCCILWQTHRVRGGGGERALKAPGYIHFVFGGFFACHVKSCNNNGNYSNNNCVLHACEPKLRQEDFPSPLTFSIHNQTNTLTIAKWNCSFSNFGIG